MGVAHARAVRERERKLAYKSRVGVRECECGVKTQILAWVKYGGSAGNDGRAAAGGSGGRAAGWSGNGQEDGAAKSSVRVWKRSVWVWKRRPDEWMWAGQRATERGGASGQRAGDGGRAWRACSGNG